MGLAEKLKQKGLEELQWVVALWNIKQAVFSWARVFWMGSVSNLVYYASVSKGTTILAEHSGPGDDLAMVAIKCLGKVPSLHSRFTYTTSGRMFNCLMDGAFTYCAIVDQALGKQKAFGFLEKVRDEFKLLLMSQGWALDGVALEAYCLNDDFMVVYRHLVKPLVGIPQKELDHMWEQMLARQSAESGADAGDDSEDHTCLLPEHHMHSEKKGNHLLESLTWKGNSRRVQQQVSVFLWLDISVICKRLSRSEQIRSISQRFLPWVDKKILSFFTDVEMY